MTKAERYFTEEFEMVIGRVLLGEFPKGTRYSGNPMSLVQGLQHLENTIAYIKEHPELYDNTCLSHPTPTLSLPAPLHACESPNPTTPISTPFSPAARVLPT